MPRGARISPEDRGAGKHRTKWLRGVFCLDGACCLRNSCAGRNRSEGREQTRMKKAVTDDVSMEQNDSVVAQGIQLRQQKLFIYMCVCMFHVCEYHGTHVESSGQPLLLFLLFHLIWDRVPCCWQLSLQTSSCLPISTSHLVIGALGLHLGLLCPVSCRSLEIQTQVLVFTPSALCLHSHLQAPPFLKGSPPKPHFH